MKVAPSLAATQFEKLGQGDLLMRPSIFAAIERGSPILPHRPRAGCVSDFFRIRSPEN